MESSRAYFAEAAEQTEKEQARESRVAEMLERFKPDHPQTITHEKLITALQQTDAQKKETGSMLKNLFRGGAVLAGLPAIENFLSRIMPEKPYASFSKLDILYNCLKLAIGKSTAHSYKFLLLVNLFQFRFDEKEAEAYVACFIKQIEKIKAAEKQADYLMLELKNLSAEQFGKVFAITSGTRSYAHIADAVTSKKLSVFDAVLEMLDAGDETFKLNFVRNLYGVDDAYLTKIFKLIIIAPIEQADAEIGSSFGYTSIFFQNISHQISVMHKDLQAKSDATKFIIAAIIKQEASAVIDDLVQTMKQDDMATHYKKTQGFVQRCASGEIDATRLANALKAIREQRAVTSSAGLFSKLKTAIRNPDALATKLETKQISVLNAIINFLSSNLGQQGPHSLKYALLQNLFALPVEVSATESKIMIDSFTRIAKEMSNSQQKVVVLSDMSQMKEKDDEEKEKKETVPLHKSGAM